MAATTPATTAKVVHRYFEVSLFLLVTVGFLALASTGQLDVPTVLLVGGALVVKALRYRRQSEPELNPKSVTQLAWFYSVFYFFDLYLLSQNFLLATSHLVLFIAVVKIYSARSNRDYLWLALVAFMEILAAATLTVDATFLAFFFLFLLLGISTFVSFEIKRSGEACAASAPRTGDAALAQRLPQSLLLTSWGVAAGVLALGTVIFFLLPRLSAGYFSAYGVQPELISGFADHVLLGDIGRIKRNQTVVMRVKADEGDSRALEGLRWRGLALAHFDGLRWYGLPERPRILHGRADGSFNLPLRPLPSASRRQLHYRVLLEPITTDVLFAASVPLALRGRFRLLGIDNTGSLRRVQRGFGLVGYDVVSDVGQPLPDELRAAGTDYSQYLRENYFQLPELDPRIAELAAEWASEFDTTYDKAAELERRLRTEFGYTLDLPQKREADPVASFLFERRKGHCEYFAASMTVMLRTLDVPARLVNGFLTGEYNEVGENYIVRAADAHTWVEVFFPGIGWVEFDPTPPDPNARQRSWWTTVQHYYDAFDLWWDEWVINYDFSQQMRLGRRLNRSVSLWSRNARRWFRRQRQALTAEINQVGENVVESPYTAPAALALALGVVLLLRGSELRDRLREWWLLRRGRQRSLSASEATLTYQHLLRVLKRKGYRRSPAQTPLEFAAALPPPELAFQVRDFTRLYNHVRFGQAPAASVQLLDLLRNIQTWKPNRKQPPQHSA